MSDTNGMTACTLQMCYSKKQVSKHYHAPLAYSLVHSFAVSTASASFVFQCLAMFSESGSSGLGALNNAWMLSKTVRIWRAGLHLSFRMSRHIRPSLSIFGWYIFVKNRTFGAAIGYSSGKNNSNLKTPPSYGDWVGPRIITLKYRMLSSEGDALIPGAGSLSKRWVSLMILRGRLALAIAGEGKRETEIQKDQTPARSWISTSSGEMNGRTDRLDCLETTAKIVQID